MSSNNPKAGSAPIVKKEVKNKVSPAKAIDLILTEDKTVGSYLRVYLATNSGQKSELIVHHPIGVTDYDDDEWIVSQPEDIPHLLVRSKDPESNKLATLKSEWMMSEAVRHGFLTETAKGDFVYVGGNPTTRKEFFDDLKKSHKENARNEKEVFDLVNAIARTTDPRGKVETKIRELFANIGAEADAKFVSEFRTMGGARADRPQVALKWAKSRTLQEILDTMLLYGVEGPPELDEKSLASSEVSASTGKPPACAASNKGNKNPQWCFLPSSLDDLTKKEVRASLKAIKDKLESTHGMKVSFHMSQVKEG